MKMQKILLFSLIIVFSIRANCQNVKTTSDSLATKNNPAESSFSGRMSKEIRVYVFGIKSSDRFKSLDSAVEKMKGVNSVKTPGFTMGQITLQINTVLNPDELIDGIKKWNPQLYYSVGVKTEQMITMAVSDRPLNTNKSQDTKTVTAPESSRDDNHTTPSVTDTAKENAELRYKEENQVYAVGGDAAFPGGNPAWIEYLQQNLNADIAKTNGAPAGTYSVVVKFIVHKDGSSSNIEAVTKRGYGMEKEAVRIIGKVPKWQPFTARYSPLIGGGSGPVNAYVKQTVVFIVSK